MPTVFGYHDVKDTDHWLASPRREEVFGPLGVTNIGTFVDPTNRTRVGVLMDGARHRCGHGLAGDRGRGGRDGLRRCRARNLVILVEA